MDISRLGPLEKSILRALLGAESAGMPLSQPQIWRCLAGYSTHLSNVVGALSDAASLAPFLSEERGQYALRDQRHLLTEFGPKRQMADVLWTELERPIEALCREPAIHGLALAGTHAMNSLRIEKAYRHWGHDIGDQDTALEAGLGFAVAWDKPGGFIGRDALAKQRGAGVTRRLVQFALDDAESLLYGNEPIWRDGVIAGSITTAMYGHTLGRAIGLGYVADVAGGCNVDVNFIDGGSYEVEVTGIRFKAAASLRPMFDAKSERVKA